MAFRRTIAAIAALSSIVVPSAALDVDLKTNLAIYWVRFSIHLHLSAFFHLSAFQYAVLDLLTCL
jgi:hypothetical protein